MNENINTKMLMVDFISTAAKYKNYHKKDILTGLKIIEELRKDYKRKSLYKIAIIGAIFYIIDRYIYNEQDNLARIEDFLQCDKKGIYRTYNTIKKVPKINLIIKELITNKI